MPDARSPEAAAARPRCPAGHAAPPIRSAASLPTSRRDVRRHGRDRVVVVRLDPHHARRLRRPEADRERRPERDRHLSEDVARATLADDALDPVDEP